MYYVHSTRRQNEQRRLKRVGRPIEERRYIAYMPHPRLLNNSSYDVQHFPPSLSFLPHQLHLPFRWHKHPLLPTLQSCSLHPHISFSSSTLLHFCSFIFSIMLSFPLMCRLSRCGCILIILLNAFVLFFLFKWCFDFVLIVSCIV